MSGLFRSSFFVFTPLPPEVLVPWLRHKLAPAQGWSDWLVRPFTHPFEGRVSDSGFDLWTHYAKLRPRARGTFTPVERGTRVDVEVAAVAPENWLLYGFVLCFLGMPTALVAAYGFWLLSLGHQLWPLFVFGPLALLLGVLALLLGSLALAAVLAQNWTRTRLTHWLTDTAGLQAARIGGGQE